jgi:hypothetical protein
MIVVLSASVVFSLSAFGLAAAAESPAADASPDQSASAPQAGGPAWCGFKDQAGSRVQCGYSSESDCKHALGGTDAICIVDPYLTENRPDRVRRG